MVLTQKLAEDYLAAVDSGDFSNFNSDDGYAAGQQARAAVDKLNATAC